MKYHKKNINIDVFVTKTHKFRARIEEKGWPPYEVTIGGKSWKNHVGIKHHEIILKMVCAIMSILQKEIVSWSEINTEEKK